MKKNIVTLFILLSSNLGAIELLEISKPVKSCSAADIENVLYIKDKSRTQFIFDKFWTDDERLISEKKTKIRYWASDKGILSGCLSPDDWKRISSLSPGNSEKVVAVGANCIFKKPVDRERKNIQFVFDIGYYEISTKHGALYPYSGNLIYFRSTKEVKDNKPKSKKYYSVGFANYKQLNNACLNIELRYCGDGIIDDSEECDDGNHINGDKCSNTCLLIEP